MIFVFEASYLLFCFSGHTIGFCGSGLVDIRSFSSIEIPLSSDTPPFRYFHIWSRKPQYLLSVVICFNEVTFYFK